MFAFKFASVAITLAVVAFVYWAHRNPAMRDQSVTTLASTMMVLGVPTLLAAAYMALLGKTAGIFFLAGLISVFAIAALLGYGLAKLLMWNRFETPMVMGFAATMIAGGPLAMVLLP